MGSPPHTRGKESEEGEATSPARITPAYAGKSIKKKGYTVDVEDHPRIRGEKNVEAITMRLIIGSPPHTRGKVHVWSFKMVQIGITPAYAGKRPVAVLLPLEDQDHPRIRGEKFGVDTLLAVKMGSPPHTRGKVADTLS